MLSDRARTQFEQALFAAFAGGQRAKAAQLLNLLGDPPSVANIPSEWWDRLAADLRAALEPILIDMAVASALGLGASAGIMGAVNWAAVNTRAETWARGYTYNLVRGINSTTRDMLRREIAAFYRDGKATVGTLAESLRPGLPELRDRLGRVMASETRANLIAVTEVTRATAEGEQRLVDEIKSQNPDANVIGVWLTSRDEHVCPLICIPLNGARDDGRGNFINPKDGQVYRLPGHPACRCGRGTFIDGL